MSANVMNSAEVDKTVSDPAATEAQTPVEPARGMAEENGEGDKGGQGLPSDSEDRLEGDAGKKGTDATAEEMPMEEDPPEAPDPTKQKRTKYRLTHFVLAGATTRARR